MKTHRILSLTACLAFAGSAAAAPVVVNTGQTVGGTTQSLSLLTNDINAFGGTTKTNPTGDGDLLVIDVDSSPSTTEYAFEWFGAGVGVAFNPVVFRYVQIDISAVSAGLQAGDGWEVSWQDDDSGTGVANNSRSSLGPIAPGVGPIVIDMTNGGTETTGQFGWGPGTIDKVRFYMFQGAVNAGESWEITAITFGSQLVPEPSSLALLGLGRADCGASASLMSLMDGMILE